MVPRRVRRPLTWSPLVAIAGLLLFPALCAAATGGGDFPSVRVLWAIL